MYRFQALYSLLNVKSLSDASKLSANITLHQVGNVKELSQKFKTSTNADELLSLAEMNYNINNATGAQNSLNRVHCNNNPDCLRKEWYLQRVLDNSRPMNKIHEDRECKKTSWDCTQEELKGIKSNISELSGIGYDLQFYNNKSSVDTLDKWVPNFILNLHTFILISFIVVFIIVIRMRSIINRVVSSA